MSAVDVSRVATDRWVDAGRMFRVVESSRSANEVLRALRAATPDDGPARTVDAVAGLIAASRVPEARELAHAALATGKMPPALAAELRVTLASLALMTPSRREALAQAEAVLAEAGLDDRVYSAAELTQLMALMAEGDFSQVRQPAEDILAGHGAATDDALLAGAFTAVGSIAWADGRVGDAIGFLRAAVARTPNESLAARHVHPRQSLAVMVGATGEFTEAETLLDQDEAEIDRTDDRAWAVAVRCWRGYVYRFAGRLDDAVREAAASLALADELGTLLFAPLALSTLAVVALRRGNLPEAADQTARCRALAEASHAPFELVLCDWIEAQMTDDPDHAVETMARVYANPSANLRLFLEAPAAPAWLVRAALRAGELQRAEELVTAIGFLAARNSEVASVTATAVHTRALLDGDSDALLEAAAMYRHSYARASAIEDSGRLLAVTEPAAARTRLEDSLPIYARIGAHHDAMRVHALLAALRGRRPVRSQHAVDGWSSLTGTERRIAELVAQGLTNLEIAHLVYLSRHTVDYHLRQIYNKLDLTSRVALTRLVVERGTNQ